MNAGLRGGARRALQGRQLLVEFVGERRRSVLVERGARPLTVITLDPSSDLDKGMGEAEGKRLVNQSIA